MLVPAGEAEAHIGERPGAKNRSLLPRLRPPPTVRRYAVMAAPIQIGGQGGANGGFPLAAIQIPIVSFWPDPGHSRSTQGPPKGGVKDVSDGMRSRLPITPAIPVPHFPNPTHSDSTPPQTRPPAARSASVRRTVRPRYPYNYGCRRGRSSARKVRLNTARNPWCSGGGGCRAS